MFGNSRTMRMNGSFEMRRAISRSLARTVAVRGALHRIAHLADDLVGAERRQHHRPGRGFGDDLGLAVDDQIGGVAGVALAEHDPCRGRTPTRSLMKARSLSLDGSISAKIRHPPQQLEFLLQAHFLPPSRCRPALLIPPRAAATSANPCGASFRRRPAPAACRCSSPEPGRNCGPGSARCSTQIRPRPANSSHQPLRRPWPGPVRRAPRSPR